MGVDEETVFRWESNKSRPQIQFIPAIIKLLGYNPLRVLHVKKSQG
jgi:DNA-binding XRE family transcriptional regulator